jgi:hypothetical protein
MGGCEMGGCEAGGGVPGGGGAGSGEAGGGAGWGPGFGVMGCPNTGDAHPQTPTAMTTIRRNMRNH